MIILFQILQLLSCDYDLRLKLLCAMILNLSQHLQLFKTDLSSSGSGDYVRF